MMRNTLNWQRGAEWAREIRFKAKNKYKIETQNRLSIYAELD